MTEQSWLSLLTYIIYMTVERQCRVQSNTQIFGTCNFSEFTVVKVVIGGQRLLFKVTVNTIHFSISLSTLVLNSRDWSEIVWLPEISRFKINLAISFIRKKNPLEFIG